MSLKSLSPSDTSPPVTDPTPPHPPRRRRLGDLWGEIKMILLKQQNYYQCQYEVYKVVLSPAVTVKRKATLRSRTVREPLHRQTETGQLWSGGTFTLSELPPLHWAWCLRCGMHLRASSGQLPRLAVNCYWPAEHGSPVILSQQSQRNCETLTEISTQLVFTQLDILYQDSACLFKS